MSKARLNKIQLIARKHISIVGAASKKDIKTLQQKRKERLGHLKGLGLIIRNNGMSVYLNRISPGCIDCSRGTGLTVGTTMECNRKCYFCINHAPERKIKLANIIKNVYKSRIFMLSLGISGGECLLELDATVDILKLAKEVVGDICQTRIYTNGDMLNRSALKRLKAAGLDEIRMSIKPGKKCLKTLALAKEYIPRVMVETPVFPDGQEEMKKLLLKLNALGIFGINLLEFLFSCRNAHIYKSKGYELMTAKVNDPSQPYLFDYPVYGSEAVCFNLLEYAAKENFGIGVHYCSFKNTHYGNYSERLRKMEISRRIKSEFEKNKDAKCNKEEFIREYWVDQILQKLKP